MSVGFLHRPVQVTRPSLLQSRDLFPAAGLSTSQLVRTDGEEQQDQSTSAKESRLASVQHESLASSSVSSTACHHLALFSHFMIDLT